jgi:hypothetical protein
VGAHKANLPSPVVLTRPMSRRVRIGQKTVRYSLSLLNPVAVEGQVSVKVCCDPHEVGNSILPIKKSEIAQPRRTNLI